MIAVLIQFIVLLDKFVDLLLFLQKYSFEPEYLLF